MRAGARRIGLLVAGILTSVVSEARAAGIDLKDPLFSVLDKILVIKRPVGNDHIVYQYFGHMSGGGGLYIVENVLSGAPTERDVLANSTCKGGDHDGKKLVGGAFLGPDLSYDATQILFSYADSGGGKFHVFKVKVDGSELTQLTTGDFEDLQPAWLPDGRIVFVSTRRGGFGRCHTLTMPTYTLYGMNADGTDIHAISMHETNEWDPSVDNNGMIIYSRWDYVDRGSAYVHHGWITTPDGLDARAIGTNYPPTMGNNIIDVPNAVVQLRAIPNSNKYVGTAVAHHGPSYGSIVVIDPDVEDDDALGQYTTITPDAKFPENQTCPKCDLKYATPWPLGEDYFLCVHDPGGGKHSIYLIDSKQNKLLLKGGGPYLEPIPLAPRHKPVVVVPSRTPPAPNQPADDVIVTLVNVYDSMYAWPDKAVIKELRIVQIHPKTTIVNNNPRLGHGGTDANEQNGRSVLGTVPVESDGSANFYLPAGKPVYFQALDADGVAVQSMMSDTYAIPGSTRLTCQGCHEPRHRTARPPKTMPLAMLRPPSKIQVEADGTKPMNFPRLIQPILEKHCNTDGCHLTKDPILSGKDGKGGFSVAYNSLYDWATFYLSYVPGIGRPCCFTRPVQILPTISEPGKINGARKSKLYPFLLTKHKGVTLTPQELRAFALWLDNNSDFYGHPENLPDQKAGKVVPPKIE